MNTTPVKPGDRFPYKKPYIFFHEGYWRVSACTSRNQTILSRWHAAHAHIREFNRGDSPRSRLLRAFGCECSAVDYCDYCLRGMSNADTR